MLHKNKAVQDGAIVKNFTALDLCDYRLKKSCDSHRPFF